MTKRIDVDLNMTDKIVSEYDNGCSLNKLTQMFSLDRRVLERILKGKNREILTSHSKKRMAAPELKDKDLLLRMYNDEGLTIDEIAVKLKVSSMLIRTVFKEHGIQSRSSKDTGLQRQVLDRAPLLKNRDWIVSEYVTKGRSVFDLTRELNVSSTALKTALTKFDIPIRSQVEQIAVSPPKGNAINSKLAGHLRVRLWHALKGVGVKRGSAVGDLGCSIEELREHLQDLFHDDQYSRHMTWDNYGKNGWEIDHIIPLSSFNLSDTDEFKKACHYTNLQPLWREDNRSKSSAILTTESFPGIDLIIVTGVSGSGKSWACNQLTDKFCYIPTDEIPKEQHLHLMIGAAKAGQHILYDPIRQPITWLRRYRGMFNTRLIIIDEDIETVKSRIIGRGGNRINNLEKFQDKMRRYKQYAEFSGTSTEVLDYLKALKLTATENSLGNNR